MAKKTSPSTIIDNRKARYNYQVIESYEAGIVLSGTEVKSIRQGNVNMADSYARLANGELYLTNMHISPYEQGNRFNPDPTRERKLLLHRSEISKLLGKIKEKGLTLIPLSLYWKQNKVKVNLGLCKAKKLYDKREAIKERDIKKEAERAIHDKH